MIITKKISIVLIVLIFLIKTSVVLNAQWSAKVFDRTVFIENKGQFDKELSGDKKNFSYCIDKGTKVFFYKNRILYKFTKPKAESIKEFEDMEREEKEKFLAQKNEQELQITFLNTNPNVSITSEEKQTAFYGYVIHEKGEAHTIKCDGYKKITYKNIYSSIDLVYEFHPVSGLKYSFVLYPGANPKQIQWKYENLTSTLTLEGIKIKTLVGDLLDKAPITFYQDNNSKIIQSSFVKSNSAYGFSLDNYDPLKSVIIDPWVSVPGLMGGLAYDNGIDAAGNTYVCASNYVVEKYSPTGTMLFSVDVSTNSAYGDMLVASNGSCYFNTAGTIGGNEHATAIDNAGNALWTRTGLAECWRFVLNECTGSVLSLLGVRNQQYGFVNINLSNGNFTNVTQNYGVCCEDPHSGAIDVNGDVYSYASDAIGVSKIHVFNSANNNTTSFNAPLIGYGTASSVYSTSAGIFGGFAMCYNGFALAGSYIYTTDGAKLYKLNKTNGAILNQVNIPNGIYLENGGIYVTSCNDIFVGSKTGVYVFDDNLVQQGFQATTGAVWDIAFKQGGYIYASGPGHHSELQFNLSTCTFATNPITVAACNGANNGSVKLNLKGGVPGYTYKWSHSATATTDSIGGLAPGTYKCVYTDNKCPIPNKDSVTITIPSIAIPSPDFSSTLACKGQAVSFQDQSVGGNASTWRWNFGDGTINTNQNTSHTYNLTSNTNQQFQVTMAISANGCKDSITKTVTVYSLPVADFNSDTVCLGTATSLLDNSQGSGNALSSYAWDFNADGVTDNTLPNPNYTFANAGTNMVTYIVSTNPISNLQCRDTVQKTVQVRVMPQADFSFQSKCVNEQPLSFDGSLSTISSGNISSYAWDFGDGIFGTGIVTTHSYNNAGNYNVTLVVKDNTSAQCLASKNYVVNVYDLPKVTISASKTCLGDVTTLTGNTLPNSPSINQWNWDLNNSINSIEANGQTTNHTYNTAGSQTVRLVAVSQNNCKDTITQTLFVNYLPNAQFSADKVSGCPELCVVFTDNSTSIAPSNIADWTWNLGDGTIVNTGLGTQQSHCYTNTTSNQVNNYAVQLTVKTDSGCVATLNKPNYISVYPEPIADYVLNPSSAPVTEPLISFTNTSKDYTKFWWYYGDSSNFDSTTVQPDHLYDSETAYDYLTALIVQNQYTCRDTIHKVVKIGPGFSFYIPNTFSPNDDGINDTFSGKGIGITKYEMWIYDRWGNMLFYTNDIYKPWDGKVQGESILVQQDTYIWKVKLKDIFNKPHDYNGHVNIVR